MFGQFSSNTPPAVKNLLLINVILFLATWLLQSKDIHLTHILGLFYWQSPYFQPYQFVTHIFMHGGLAHIFMNMFALWMFGSALETNWGTKRFLFYYFFTGLGAAVLHLTVNGFVIGGIAGDLASYGLGLDQIKAIVTLDYPEARSLFYEISRETGAPVSLLESAFMQLSIPTVGASGAVFGLLLAFGMAFPNVRLMLLFFPVPIKAKYFVIFYGLLELYLGVYRITGDNIAHFAHVGGMVFGWLLIRYWSMRRKYG